MHRILLPILTVSFFLSVSARTEEPDWVTVGEARLTVGWVFKVYDAVYALPPETDAEESVLADCAKRLELRYLRPIPKQQFIDAATDLMTGFLDTEAIAVHQASIDRINAAYQDVREGDVYSLTYLPGRGTELMLNGEVRALIPGAAFARDYFRIWTDPKCKYPTFRRQLLGLNPR